MKFRMFCLAIFGLFTLNLTVAQVYLKDLQNGDLEAVEKKMSLLDTSFKKEPVLALYLANSNATPEVVKALLDKGASVTLVSPKQKLPPLFVAITNGQSAKVVKVLLDAGAKFEMPYPGTWGKTIVEYAIRDQQFRSATYLLLLNAKAPAKGRLSFDKKYDSVISVLIDNVDQTKKIVASEGLSESDVWKLAIAGQAKGVLKLLLTLNDRPEIESEDLILLVADHDLFDFALQAGFVLTEQQLGSGSLYRELIAAHDVGTIQKVRSMDRGARPELYGSALEAGLDVFMAVTNSLSDLNSELLWERGYFSKILAISNYETVEPILVKNMPSGPQLMDMYRENVKQFGVLLKNDKGHLLTLKGSDSYDRQNFWNSVLDNDDTSVLMAIPTLDQDVPVDFLKTLMKKSNETFVALLVSSNSYLS